ncbi:MAG: hypothetical protein HY928_11075, partial [Elusimicrobia bacterium]|nr:hypothetical protein [Elusimicrobiota bacterium]
MADKEQRPVSNPPIPPLAGGPKKAKEEDGGGVALPMWSSKGGDKLAGMPMFRGAAAGAKPNSLLGRMKNLKTKDLAFIGAGLAVLVMAPLAEYLISESGEANGPMTQGFDHKGSMFPSGSDPNEMGNMLARGGLIGENPDVITPINARDPSSLIIAPGGEKEAPPVTPPVEPKRDAPKDNMWDKVVSSAKSGASTAARKVGLPKPNARMAGAISGLRGAAGGSTSAKLTLDKLSSERLVGKPRNENHMAPTQAAPGYRGTGSRSIAAGTGGGGFDGRRGPGGAGGAGGAAGDVMGGGVS